MLNQNMGNLNSFNGIIQLVVVDHLLIDIYNSIVYYNSFVIHKYILFY